MAYIVSRGFQLPETHDGMADGSWYVLWKRRVGLYSELVEGDEMYWYESPAQKIVWRTTVVKVDRMLCPNHHKEFDYGELAIHEQSPSFVRGTLNGRPFHIGLNAAALT